jgi:hypothetical protein
MAYLEVAGLAMHLGLVGLATMVHLGPDSRLTGRHPRDADEVPGIADLTCEWTANSGPFFQPVLDHDGGWGLF